MLTRMFAYFTLVMYLVVGGMAVRIFAPEMTTVAISSSYLNLLSSTEIKSAEIQKLETPVLAFEKIQFPVEKKIVRKVVKVVKPLAKKALPVTLITYHVEKNELPFYEPVVLKKIEMTEALPVNLASLYQDFSYTETAIAQVEDAVTTKQAKSNNVIAKESKDEAIAEPEFYEYETKEVTASSKPSEEKVSEHKIDSKVLTKASSVEPEEVALDDLVTFDYSAATKDAQAQNVTLGSSVTTQIAQPVAIPSLAKGTLPIHHKKIPVVSKVDHALPMNALMATQKKPMVPTKTYAGQMTIQIVGTDLKGAAPVSGFEIRMQDDLSEVVQDYNSGSVAIDYKLAVSKMTRSMAFLKHGFAPTNTDMILEDGYTETSVPMIDQEVFNDFLAPYEARGPVGAVLIELDDEAEGASLDVPYARTIMLDGDLKETAAGDFRYQLFIGVKAGNALLSYSGMKGDLTSKIIHIHEREVTYESNFFEAVSDEKIELYEEDLLSKEKMPLIITSSQVKQFATDKTAKKIDDHTYKMNFNRTLLGARRYVELDHQAEPIFVGVRSNKKINVPSENFMRFVLSRFEEARLGNRCLVQVNLSKKALKLDVASESVDSSLVTYTQVLDRDGKFYDSIGDKSEKIIIVGENQSSIEANMDAKINVKITYQDGSVQFLGSYCSPNTYLVEQL